MWSNIVENIHTHIWTVNFVYTVVFDVETASKNVKLAILERLELQIFYAQPYHGVWDWEIGMFPSKKSFTVFYKNQNAIFAVMTPDISHPVDIIPTAQRRSSNKMLHWKLAEIYHKSIREKVQLF